ncbi:MAG TPA: sugar phosphate nucleotidyltransferase [Candidatus Paceibacterota bacterium]
MNAHKNIIIFMKAIILAAGKGIRMYPLTFEIPKPLLKWKDKTLLEHAIDVLPDEVDEIIIVVGYMEDKIRRFFENINICKKITFISQNEITGTAPALMLCKDKIKNEKFILMYADDIHDKVAVKHLLYYDLALLTMTIEDPRMFGVVLKDEEGNVTDIEEKPQNPKSNEVAVGVYLLDDRIFDFFDDKHRNSKEYYLTEMIAELIHHHKVHAVPTPFWKKVTTPKDLEG